MIYFLASLALAFFLWKATSSFWRRSIKKPKRPELEGTSQDVSLEPEKPRGQKGPENTPFDPPGPDHLTAKEPEGGKARPRQYKQEEGEQTVWVGTVHLGEARGGDEPPSLLTLRPTPLMQEVEEVEGGYPRDSLEKLKDVSHLKPDSGLRLSPAEEVEGCSYLKSVSMETRCRQEWRMTSFSGEIRGSEDLELGSEGSKEELALGEEVLEDSSRTVGEKVLREGSQTPEEELFEKGSRTFGEELLRDSSQTAWGKPFKDGLQTSGEDLLEGGPQTSGGELLECSQTEGEERREGSQTSMEELLRDGSQNAELLEGSQTSKKELLKEGFQTPGEKAPEGSSPPRKKPAGGIRLFGGTELLDKIEKRRVALEKAEISGPPGTGEISPDLETTTGYVDQEATDPGEPLALEPRLNILPTEGNVCPAPMLSTEPQPSDNLSPTGLPSLADQGPVSDGTTSPRESPSPPGEGSLFLPEGEALTHLNKDRPRGPAKRRPSFNTGRT